MTKRKKLGKEAKVGLAVIFILLLCFGVVLIRRLSGSAQALQEAAAEEGERGGAKPKLDGMPREGEAAAGAQRKPTLVGLRKALSETTKQARADRDQWAVVADEKPAKHSGGNASSGSPPTLMPYPPKASTVDPSDRYGNRYAESETPRTEQRHDHDIAAADTAREKEREQERERERSDPFHSRTTLYPPADPKLGSQPDYAARQQESPRAGSEPFRPRGYGQSAEANAIPGESSPHAVHAPEMPRYGEDRRYGDAALPRGREPESPYAANENRGFGAAPSTTVRSSPPYGSSYPAAPYRMGGDGFRAGAGNAQPFAGRNGRRDDGTYEVQPNDTYWTISEKLYGTGAYFKALAEENRKKVPQEDRLQVGDVVITPELEQLEKKYPDLCPKPSHREIAKRRTSTVSATSQYATGRTYVTEKGDTLFDIARNELGKASRWAEIYELNRDQLGPDYNYLPPGLQLAMPEKDAGDTLTRRPAPMPVYRR